MKAASFVSREFSTARRIQTYLYSRPNPRVSHQDSTFDAELCFSTILDRYPDINLLRSVHCKILADCRSRYDPAVAVKLMRSYAACGDTSSAQNVFGGITEKGVVSYNVMIRGFVNNGRSAEALAVYKSMLGDGFRPDKYTYPCVLKACSLSEKGGLSVGLQVHVWAVKCGLDLNLFVGNGLVAMYGKGGYLVEARRVLEEMPRKDVVTWNSLVAGFTQNGLFDDALSACKEMERLELEHDAGTMASLFPAVTSTSDDNVSYVEKMFSNLSRKSLVSWNVMIAMYVNNSNPGRAVDLYLKMEELEVEPDAVTLASVLPACGDLSALSIGKRIHEIVERKKLRPNLLLENALIDMYAKCGCLSEAREVFDHLKIRDVVSWTSMITAYGMRGLGYVAVDLFSELRNSGLHPDSIAFVSVLSACSHSGLLDDGRRLFKMMTVEYRIEPRMEHCACMVDLLGRVGKVDEAYRFIKNMPIEPNERVWGALLGACRIHSFTSIGLLAADHLFQLAPEQPGYYVLLSNIYAKAGRWKEVSEVRSIMKSMGMKKTPGQSNVELKGRVHTFLAGDQYHPQSELIYRELDTLLGKIKEAGYVPEMDETLHDVEDEDKEGHLVVHSEKLAVAFAILNTEPKTPIRITKNLRICSDCHRAVRIISKITEREIIVRDANRFHRFMGGVCSCANFW
ncbi:hypothetical protein MLD38_026926 [Melastoma candidum]|uniref:Uncharacterized protein n=1 Tax=Melastoma candidum TaxID=119954 RepID=A0ACB9P122_9MYRT|nr:hypothetical protein MLD38_026926 [Melastoma candidum]